MINSVTSDAAYLARTLDRRIEAAKSEALAKIGWIRRLLDEAEARLNAGETANRCGVVQGSASELDMAVARHAALCDLKPDVVTVTAAVTDAD